MPAVDADKLVAHLKEKWGSRPCPMCNVNKWNVSGDIYDLRKHADANSIVVGGPVVPVFPITCTNCGNTILINAVAAGFFRSSRG